MMAFGGLLLLLGLLGGILNLITLIGAVILFMGMRSFRGKDARAGLANRKTEQTFQASVLDKPMRFTFEEEGFSVWEPSGVSSYRYHALTAVWEDEERCYLFLQGKMRYILQKSAFTQGTPDDFHVWISKKTGKPVEYIQ